MKFTIFVVDSDRDKLSDLKSHIDYKFKLIKYDNTDSEVDKYTVEIDSIEKLMELPYILGDDIVIYGSNADILMTKNCLKELGLS